MCCGSNNYNLPQAFSNHLHGQAQSRTGAHSKNPEPLQMRPWPVSTIFTALLAICALAELFGEPPDYRLAPGDVIKVTVRPQCHFDSTVTVRADGRISYPLVGQLQAAGLTMEQFAYKLRNTLDQNIMDPKVSVSLKESNQQAARRVSLAVGAGQRNANDQSAPKRLDVTMMAKANLAEKDFLQPEDVL